MHRIHDIIYHRQSGAAFTYDILVPDIPNGAGVILPLGGAWRSGHKGLAPFGPENIPNDCLPHARNLIDAGYTVFCLIHGSQPFFTIPDIIEQCAAAVQHIRKNTEYIGVNPAKIGALGGSSSGHLSLMLGSRRACGQDPIQAVVAYASPTDFLNYGEPGGSIDDHISQLNNGVNPLAPALEHRHIDATSGQLNIIRPDSFPAEATIDSCDQKAIYADHLRKISPITHIAADSAATFLLHGTKDVLIPLQQSECLRDRCQELGIAHDFFVKENGPHSWPETADELAAVRQWFDLHLLVKKN